MLSLHTNAATLSAQSAIGRTQSGLSTSMTRLSTGYRINSASDDAAGLQIATRLKAQTSGMAVAMRNTQNATSMMQTAEGALGETSNILVRMKDLATQAADASSTAADKKAMQSEFDALAGELSNIVGNTSFGGAKLLTTKASAGEKAAANAAQSLADVDVTNAQLLIDDAGVGLQNDYEVALAALDPAVSTTADDLAAATDALKAGQKDLAAKQAVLANATAYNSVAATSSVDGKFAASLSFQIGASSAETMSLDLSSDLGALHTALRDTSSNYNSFGASLGVTGTELTGATVGATIDKLSAAIDSVATVRSSLGAATNRLDHVATNLANISTNTEAAAGRIMDVDFATESSKMTQNQMLMQAGTAMLKQTNQMSSTVMSLLQ